MARSNGFNDQAGDQGTGGYGPAGDWGGFNVDWNGQVYGRSGLQSGYAPSQDMAGIAGFSPYGNARPHHAAVRTPAVRLGKHAGRGPRGYQRSDQRIHEDVCELFTADSELDASGIDVSVNNGEVALNGSVPSRYQRILAEIVADGVLGVSDIRNNLRVRSARAEEPAGGSRQGQPPAPQSA